MPLFQTQDADFLVCWTEEIHRTCATRSDSNQQPLHERHCSIGLPPKMIRKGFQHFFKYLKLFKFFNERTCNNISRLNVVRICTAGKTALGTFNTNIHRFLPLPKLKKNKLLCIQWLADWHCVKTGRIGYIYRYGSQTFFDSFYLDTNAMYFHFWLSMISCLIESEFRIVKILKKSTNVS